MVDALLETLLTTGIVAAVYLACKKFYDDYREVNARATVVVIGGGPIGLVSALIAAGSGKAAKILLYEENSKCNLLKRPQQLAIDGANGAFLGTLGIDLGSVEGCWRHGVFYCRLAVFQEHLLELLGRKSAIDVRLNTKFTADRLNELEALSDRLIVVVCDGSNGRSASLFGLSDETSNESCKAYGAQASFDLPTSSSVPTPCAERRTHNLTFDLTSYGLEHIERDGRFHFKCFGTSKKRYMSLAVPKCESKIVKTLKTAIDQSVMRNIFRTCYDHLRYDDEKIPEEVVHKMKFSPRLYEIKLQYRIENSVFIEDANLFVAVEGEASCNLNFQTGMNINLCLRRLQSLSNFIKSAASAQTESSILQTLKKRHNHIRYVQQDFIRHGLKRTIFS